MLPSCEPSSPQGVCSQEGRTQEDGEERHGQREGDRHKDEWRIEQTRRERPGRLEENEEVLVEYLDETECCHDTHECEQPAGRHRRRNGRRGGKPSAVGSGSSFPRRGASLGVGAAGLLPPGVTFAILVNLFLLGAALLAAWAWRTGRLAGRIERGSATGDRPSDPMEWRSEGSDLAREVQAVVESTDDVVTDRDRLARRLVPLSARLKGHARAAPDDVDGAAVERVFGLGEDCYEVAMEHSLTEATRTGTFFEDKLHRLATTAAEVETALAE